MTLGHAAGALAKGGGDFVCPSLAASLAEKVAFLSRPDAYPHRVDAVVVRETHMSWVFLAGPRVYKLKKPVRFPYLDFSTLARRETACRAELRLNRRLAGDVYVDVLPLTAARHGLALAGSGVVVDWLVVMRRLDERCMLDHAIAAHRVDERALDRLVTLLAHFYRHAAPIRMTGAAHLADWRKSIADNRRGLSDPRAQVPAGLASFIDGVQERFVARFGSLLAARAASGHIVDAHGDLRPEHIWLGCEPRIIDCLEFNDKLRANDPFDEIAFLTLECERLGAAWVARYLRRRLVRAVRDAPPAALFAFYRCHRATLRARLAVAHLFEKDVRTPEKWPAQARDYLHLVAADAWRLDAMLRGSAGRRGFALRAIGG
jgi:aminoglycoside phosphotransferase family enzyme